MSPSHPKILFDHGEGNLGDEAMLLAVLSGFREIFGDAAQFTVTSPSPESRPHRPDDILSTPSPNACSRITLRPLVALLEHGWRWRWLSKANRVMRPFMVKRMRKWLCKPEAAPQGHPVRELAQVLSESDAVHMVGGGYLNSIWPHTMLWPKWALVSAARDLGKPVFFSGQGVGPIYGQRERRPIREMLEAADRFTLREQLTSPDLLRSLGVEPSNFEFIGDDAHTLKAAAFDDIAPLLPEALRSEGSYICANVRFAEYADHYDLEIDRLANFLDRAVEYSGRPVLFLSMTIGDDRNDIRSAKEVARRMRHGATCPVVESTLTPGQAKAIVAGARATVTVAYHAAVFAFSSRSSALMLYRGKYYASKMTGLADCYHVPELAVPFERIVGGGVDQTLRLLLDNSDRWSNAVGAACDEITSRITQQRQTEAEIILKHSA
jgi:polysaccharide pyruvyl transferase WcaK-like protein